AAGAVSGAGPGAAVICANGWRASLDSLSASIRIGDTMSTAITSLTARIPSPSATREEVRPPSMPEDKEGGLGYNRGLIGAAQALQFDWATADRPQTAELTWVIGARGSGQPSPAMATVPRRLVCMSRSKWVSFAMLATAVLLLGTSLGFAQDQLKVTG